MDEELVAVFIPIIFILVTGFVIITYFYLRGKERFLLIERGLTSEEIKEFYKSKKDEFILLKIGIIVFFFGLGLGFGLMLLDMTDKEFYPPFLIFSFTGLGFITANLLSRSLRKKETAD